MPKTTAAGASSKTSNTVVQKKKITEKTILKRALKQGINDSLFYLWLKHNEDKKANKLHEIWSNPDLIWKESQKPSSEYTIKYLYLYHAKFKKDVKDFEIEKKNKKKKKKKKKNAHKETPRN